MKLSERVCNVRPGQRQCAKQVRDTPISKKHEPHESFKLE